MMRRNAKPRAAARRHVSSMTGAASTSIHARLDL
jgi:hypothetical protein